MYTDAVYIEIRKLPTKKWEFFSALENKAFRGFCGFIFFLFEPFFCGGSSFVFLILHHFLTIAGIVKRFEWGGAEPCIGSDKKYLTAAQAAIQK